MEDYFFLNPLIFEGYFCDCQPDASALAGWAQNYNVLSEKSHLLPERHPCQWSAGSYISIAFDVEAKLETLTLQNSM